MRTFFGIFLLTFTVITFGQTDSSRIFYPHLDTLIIYDVSLKAETGPGYARYFVNGEEVRKIIYDSYKKFWDNIGKCKPCFLRTYNTDDILVREGVQFMDCGVGSFREYYPSGVTKIIGSYKINKTGNWEQLFQKGYCRMVGKWTYYGPAGNVLKTEDYIDGQLVE